MAPPRKVWLFDLDDTLHDATSAAMRQLTQAMSEYMVRELQITPAESDALRRRYWQRYGATLSGMMRHHATDPDHFLWHTHQFPQLPQMVLREARLRHVLKRLPGKKLVFSNAPQHYAYAVLQLLRIDDLFDDVFAIEHTRYQPKPQLAGFIRLLRKHRLNPARCVMVEDSAENLQTAKRLGMLTVWVNATSRLPTYVDVKIRDVMKLPRILSRLN